MLIGLAAIMVCIVLLPAVLPIVWWLLPYALCGCGGLLMACAALVLFATNHHEGVLPIGGLGLGMLVLSSRWVAWRRHEGWL